MKNPLHTQVPEDAVIIFGLLLTAYGMWTRSWWLIMGGTLIFINGVEALPPIASVSVPITGQGPPDAV